MLSLAVLCVCAVAGEVSARSTSWNFLDDKWLTARWDKFRDVSYLSLSFLPKLSISLTIPRLTSSLYLHPLLCLSLLRSRAFSFSPYVRGMRITGQTMNPEACSLVSRAPQSARFKRYNNNKDKLRGRDAM